MATVLTRPIERELDGVYFRNRTMIVRMRRDGIEVKLKKERWASGYFLPWQSVYTQGARIKVLLKQKEKEAKKKHRKVTRGSLLGR